MKLMFSLEVNGQTLKGLPLYRDCLEAKLRLVRRVKDWRNHRDTVIISHRGDGSLMKIAAIGMEKRGYI